MKVHPAGCDDRAPVKVHPAGCDDRAPVKVDPTGCDDRAPVKVHPAGCDDRVPVKVDPTAWIYMLMFTRMSLLLVLEACCLGLCDKYRWSTVFQPTLICH